MSPPITEDINHSRCEKIEVEGIKEAVLKELGVSESQLTDDIAALRHWINHQHHFPTVIIEDILLASFIVGCKGNLDKAKSKLDGYFTCRGKFPDIFTNRDPLDPEFLKYAKTQPLITLEGRTNDGCRVHVTWLEGDEYDVTAWTKRIISQWELLLRTDPWSTGEILLISGNHFTFSHAAKLTPNHVITLFSLAQNVYPLRIKGIWFFNAPPACDFIVNKLLKPVITKKLSDRIQVYSGNRSVLFKHFPSKMLPEDYGGQAALAQTLNDKGLDDIAKLKDWFLGEGSLTTDESKRPSSTQDSFGSIAGSFRKLIID